MRNHNSKDLPNLIEGIEGHRLSLQTFGPLVEHYDLPLSHFPCNRAIRMENSYDNGKLFHLTRVYKHTKHYNIH